MKFTSLRASDRAYYSSCVNSKSNDSRPKTGKTARIYNFACYHGDVRVDASHNALIIELSGSVMVYNIKLDRLLFEDKACPKGAEFILSYYNADKDDSEI